MNIEELESIEVKAEKFQKLILGAMLFSAYILNFIPAVIFVAVIMAISFVFTAKYTPFYRLYIQVKKSAPSLEVTNTVDCQANRFACALGFVFLIGSFVAFYLKLESFAWFLVLVVGSLAVVSGTIGFCLGTALYARIFLRKQK